MTITLSTTNLGRLETTLATLLAPLDHPTVEDWGRAAIQAMHSLLGAEQMFFMVPVAGCAPAVLRCGNQRMPEIVTPLIVHRTGDFIRRPVPSESRW